MLALPLKITFFKKIGNIALFHLFPNGILPLASLESNEVQGLGLESMPSHAGAGCTYAGRAKGKTWPLVNRDLLWQCRVRNGRL